jgi:hypothetical protein
MNAKLALIPTWVYCSLWESRNDDHPTTYAYKAFWVEMLVEGKVKWGPFKKRSNAKREHEGVSTIRFKHSESFVSKEESYVDKGKADADCREAALARLDRITRELEAKGFVVLRDDSRQLDMRDDWRWRPEITWLENPPPERLRHQAVHGIKLDDIVP